ncbi:hypothetical protein O5559_27970, partial [Escherichia coli]|nr:hypothetical protein [Escherichia coli]
MCYHGRHTAGANVRREGGSGKTAQGNLKLGRNYPEPKLSYTQRGTSAGTA